MLPPLLAQLASVATTEEIFDRLGPEITAAAEARLRALAQQRG